MSKQVQVISPGKTASAKLAATQAQANVGSWKKDPISPMSAGKNGKGAK